MSNTINNGGNNNNAINSSFQDPSSYAASAGNTADTKSKKSWFEAMSKAWGTALDQQASKITDLSNQIDQGSDTPSVLTQLTAENLKFGFVSQNASTSNNAVGQALETLGRKQ